MLDKIDWDVFIPLVIFCTASIVLAVRELTR